MIRNYLKIAFRNLVKYRFYAMLNIGGLSIGIAFVLLTFGFVWRELYVNSNLRHLKNQYILTSQWTQSNMGNEFTTFGQLAKTLKERYPNLIENYYRFDGITTNVAKGDQVFREDIQIGDSSFLTMFGFPLMYGNTINAFKNPYSIVITPEIALKYFGKLDVVGQHLDIQNFSGQKHNFTITGIVDIQNENLVTNLLSNKACGVYASVLDLTFFNRNMAWQNNSIPSYIELKNGINPSSLQLPMQQLIAKNMGTDIQRNLHPKLESLNSYYLNGNNSVNKKMLFAIITIASFILLMAIANFVNLSISRSTTRAKEIGLRKVLGSQRKQLIFQFLAESYLLVIVSTLFGLILYILTSSIFSKIVGKDIPQLWNYPLYTIVYLVLFIFFVGLLTGLYPAFIMSSFKPIDSLKSKWASFIEPKYLRKILIVIQFSIATIVIVNVCIVGKQVSFLLNTNTGFDKNYIITAQLPRDWTKSGVQKMEGFRQQFLKLPNVKDVSLSFEIPNGNSGGSVPIYRFGSDSANAISARNLVTDANYLDTYQISLASGSFFSKNASDSGFVVLNEMAIHSLGWKNANEAIGQQIKIPNDPTIFTIKGATKDFNFGSLQSKISPILFFNVNNVTAYRYFSFKLQSGNLSQTINSLEHKWKELMPDAAFEYSFMDDTLKQLYEKELQFKNATYMALVLSLIMVATGILGLISLSIQKRMKEVAIRKVLGASIQNITQLFVREYTWILLLANILALPIALIIGKSWLNNYAYHIPLSMYPFLIAVSTIVIFALGIIILQTSKTALTNPVKNLRSE